MSVKRKPRKAKRKPSRFEKAIEQIVRWKFATDGRKFDGNHKEVLKEIMQIAKESKCRK